MQREGSHLFTALEKEYGERYKDHLIEQYKDYVQSTEKISENRQSANNYFITINTVLISLISLSLQDKYFEQYLWVQALLAFLGIIICTIFWHLLNSYKQLNSGKFKVIHEIEKKLPLSLYSYEWHILGEGKDKYKYHPFSHIEILVPRVFGVVYVVLCGVFLYHSKCIADCLKLICHRS